VGRDTSGLKAMATSWQIIGGQMPRQACRESISALSIGQTIPCNIHPPVDPIPCPLDRLHAQRDRSG